MDRLPTIKRIIADQLGRDESEINPESSLVEDLGADSLDTIEILMAFEEEYDIEVNDEDAEKCHTVSDIAALLDRINPEEG